MEMMDGPASLPDLYLVSGDDRRGDIHLGKLHGPLQALTLGEFGGDC